MLFSKYAKQTVAGKKDKQIFFSLGEEQPWSKYKTGRRRCGKNLSLIKFDMFSSQGSVQLNALVAEIVQYNKPLDSSGDHTDFYTKAPEPGFCTEPTRPEDNVPLCLPTLEKLVTAVKCV